MTFVLTFEKSFDKHLVFQPNFVRKHCQNCCGFFPLFILMLCCFLIVHECISLTNVIVFSVFFCIVYIVWYCEWMVVVWRQNKKFFSHIMAKTNYILKILKFLWKFVFLINRQTDFVIQVNSFRLVLYFVVFFLIFLLVFPVWLIYDSLVLIQTSSVTIDFLNGPFVLTGKNDR